MNTDYRPSNLTPLQQKMAETFYEKNLEKLVKSEEKSGRHIYYECHIDWWEWGLFQEYETIRSMDFDTAADYVVEWLKTRYKTFYKTPRYTQMLNEMLQTVDANI